MTKELFNSDALYQCIEEAKLSIYGIDGDGNIIYCNNNAIKSLGYSRNELLKLSVFDIDSKMSALDWAKHRKENSFFKSDFIESEHIMKNGTRFPVEITYSYVQQNKKVYSLCFINNISKRKEAEKKLLESQRNMFKAMGISQLGHWEYDFKLDLFTFNDVFYSMFKTSAEEIGGYKMSSQKYIELFVYQDDIPDVVQEITKAKETRDPNFIGKMEHRILYGDGNVGNISVRYYIFKNKEGETIKSCGVNQDISNQKLIHTELLKAKEKAEESDHLKSAFLANMSHEIRTPMNGILGFTELLKKPEIDDTQKFYYINIIKNSGAKMLNIVNNLIDISKIEAKQVELYYECENLSSVTDNLYQFFKPEAEQRNIHLKYTKELSFSKGMIMTDKVKLNQILTNLIQNALKFTRNGTVEFGYKLYDKDPEQILFYVKDTGIGIKPGMQNKIFERFRQGDLAYTKSINGAGLGLSITKAFVELLGGRIWVESMPNIGSVFYFTLPNIISNENKVVEKSSLPEININRPLTVLITEDDENSYLFLKEVFKEFNFEILYAKNGREAINFVKSDMHIDLVLMDIKMNEINGYDITRKIKQLRPRIPVIAQSAFVTDEDQKKAFDAGCIDFIPKPIEKDLLLHKVTQVSK